MNDIPEKVAENPKSFIDTVFGTFADKLRSPLYSTFLIVFVIWNWHIFVTLFFVSGDIIYSKYHITKDLYIYDVIIWNQHWMKWFVSELSCFSDTEVHKAWGYSFIVFWRLIIPVLSTLITIKWVSKIANWAYGEEQINEKDKLDRKTKAYEAKNANIKAKNDLQASEDHRKKLVSLMISPNGIFSGVIVGKGQTNVRIGSFNLQASNADDLNVTTMRIALNVTAVVGINNLTLKVGTTTIASAIANPTLTGNIFSINGGALKVPANSTITVDLYADINTATMATSVVVCLEKDSTSSVGVETSVSVTSPDTLVTSSEVSIVGNGALTVEADSLTPAKQILVAGMTNVEVLRFKVRADNNEDIRLDKLDIGTGVSNTTTNFGLSFTNMKLFDGTTQVGGGSATFVANVAKFTGLNFIVPKSGSKSLSLRVDTTVSTTLEKGTNAQLAPVGFEYTGTASGSLTPFSVVPNTIAPSAVMSLQDVKVVVASTMASPASKQTGNTNADIAMYSLKAEGTRDISISVLKVKMTGSAAASVTNARLRYNNADYAVGVIAGGILTFTLAVPIVVTAGTTVSVGVRADTSAIAPAPNATLTLQTMIDGVHAVVDASNGVSYSYTDANAVASGTITLSDSYPVLGAILSY